MIDVQWIKLSTDFFTNRKIAMIRDERCGDKYVLVWIFLLTLAGRLNSDGRLMFSENMPYNSKIIAKESGFSLLIVENAIKLFLKYEMLTERDGVYVIKNWVKHQNAERLSDIREKTRTRVREFRERQREASLREHMREVSCGEGELLSAAERLELVERIGEKRLSHYLDVVRSCIARGKVYTKTSVFDAIIKMAEADAKEALENKPTTKTGVRNMTNEDVEKAFQTALARSFGDKSVNVR